MDAIELDNFGEDGREEDVREEEEEREEEDTSFTENINNANAEFDNARNSHNRLIRSSIHHHYCTEIRNIQGNTKHMWKTINNLISKSKKSSNTTEIRDKNGETIHKTDIPNAFNNHFTDLGYFLSQNISNCSLPPESYVRESTQEFTFCDVTEQEVYQLLSSLSPTKASGLDRLPAKLIKLASPYITKSLTIIFNRSLSTGIFPCEWKIARVIPIYKSGPKFNMDNYRPISIISVIAKTMEKLAHNQIYSSLQSANILTNSQHGFRPLHSTVTELLKMSNQWYQNMDEGLINGVVFLDLKKAFDTVDHNILLKKLHLYGVRGGAYDWFKSYLSNRTQYCQVNGNLSESRTIIIGIPQGSILGPLLFLIYINDLPNCLKNVDCEMFADDTQIETASNDAIATAETLNEDLENISVWMAANKLSINKSKTEFMLIGSHQKLKQCNSDLQIKIGDTLIQRVTASKSLGMMIDETLTWHAQTDLITKKVNKSLYICP